MSVIRHVVVRGRVQGVGYRAFVEDEALRLGLEGWVRNRRDGTVEAVFSGADEAVAAMIEACRRGPSAARGRGGRCGGGRCRIAGAAPSGRALLGAEDGVTCARVATVLALAALLLVGASAQQQPAPPDPNAEEASMLGYGDREKTCTEWTDGCMTCTRPANGDPHVSEHRDRVPAEGDQLREAERAGEAELSRVIQGEAEGRDPDDYPDRRGRVHGSRLRFARPG